MFFYVLEKITILSRYKWEKFPLDDRQYYCYGSLERSGVLCNLTEIHANRCSTRCKVIAGLPWPVFLICIFQYRLITINMENNSSSLDKLRHLCFLSIGSGSHTVKATNLLKMTQKRSHPSFFWRSYYGSVSSPSTSSRSHIFNILSILIFSNPRVPGLPHGAQVRSSLKLCRADAMLSDAYAT